MSTTPNKPIKVDVVVHGRFHGFALTKALLELGHDAVVHTNYPLSVVEEFGVPRKQARSLLLHGIGTRIAGKLGALQPTSISEPFFHKAFGRWAAHSARADSDLIYGFSGVMKEMLRRPRGHARQLRTVVRGSSHIREQARLLEEEERRVGVAIDRPSEWMIAREEREYLLADCILVLSRFALASFVARGVDRRRLLLNPLGVNLAQFRPTPEILEARVKRILSGAPLKVLNVGTLSAQKGTFDLVEIVKKLRTKLMFGFVGTTLDAEVGQLLEDIGVALELRNRVPEKELHKIYAEADVFIFPTIQDGFAAVLLQASSACLPVIATTNSSAPDFIEEDKTGWIVPIRRADRFIERLEWCDANRPAVAAMVRHLATRTVAREWSDMASELVSHYQRVGLD